MNLRWKALGSASLIAIAVAYNPDDALAAPPVYNWSGFYVGANAGYGWGEGHEGLDFGKFDTQGLVFGVQGGYNMHWQGFVVGFEVDAMLGSVDGGKDLFFKNKSASLRSSMDWAGTARIRAGFPVENFLIYGTGGVAFGEWKTRFRFDNGIDIESFRDTQFHLGWTIGAGIEYGLSKNFSVKAEYLYLDFGKEKYRVGAERTSIDQNLNMIRLGVNYRFAPPPAPP